MTSEEFYPTEEELWKIENWPVDKFHELFDFIEPKWSYYGRLTRKNKTYDLATGGWSGNEEMIVAMRRNFLFWSVCWQLSERGGHHVFEIPIFDTGKMEIAAYSDHPGAAPPREGTL